MPKVLNLTMTLLTYVQAAHNEFGWCFVSYLDDNVLDVDDLSCEGFSNFTSCYGYPKTLMEINVHIDSFIYLNNDMLCGECICFLVCSNASRVFVQCDIFHFIINENSYVLNTIIHL